MKLVDKQGVFDNFLKSAITIERMRMFENGFHRWNQRENSFPTIYIKILCENIYIIFKMHLHPTVDICFRSYLKQQIEQKSWKNVITWLL